MLLTYLLTDAKHRSASAITGLLVHTVATVPDRRLKADTSLVVTREGKHTEAVGRLTIYLEVVDKYGEDILPKKRLGKCWKIYGKKLGTIMLTYTLNTIQVWYLASHVDGWNTAECRTFPLLTYSPQTIFPRGKFLSPPRTIPRLLKRNLKIGTCTPDPNRSTSV